MAQHLRVDHYINCDLVSVARSADCVSCPRACTFTRHFWSPCQESSRAGAPIGGSRIDCRRNPCPGEASSVPLRGNDSPLRPELFYRRRNQNLSQACIWQDVAGNLDIRESVTY